MYKEKHFLVAGVQRKAGGANIHLAANVIGAYRTAIDMHNDEKTPDSLNMVTKIEEVLGVFSATGNKKCFNNFTL